MHEACKHCASAPDAIPLRDPAGDQTLMREHGIGGSISPLFRTEDIVQRLLALFSGRFWQTLGRCLPARPSREKKLVDNPLCCRAQKQNLFFRPVAAVHFPVFSVRNRDKGRYPGQQFGKTVDSVAAQKAVFSRVVHRQDETPPSKRLQP